MINNTVFSNTLGANDQQVSIVALEQSSGNLFHQLDMTTDTNEVNIRHKLWPLRAAEWRNELPDPDRSGRYVMIWLLYVSCPCTNPQCLGSNIFNMFRVEMITKSRKQLFTLTARHEWEESLLQDTLQKLAIHTTGRSRLFLVHDYSGAARYSEENAKGYCRCGHSTRLRQSSWHSRIHSGGCQRSNQALYNSNGQSWVKRCKDICKLIRT
jgi:hypothetical protein